MTPSDSPSWISNAKTPAHQPRSGSPAGPSQHGHSILQLQNSMLRPEIFHPIEHLRPNGPVYARPPIASAQATQFLHNLAGTHCLSAITQLLGHAPRTDAPLSSGVARSERGLAAVEISQRAR